MPVLNLCIKYMFASGMPGVAAVLVVACYTASGNVTAHCGQVVLSQCFFVFFTLD
jgi:hypothetical protein